MNSDTARCVKCTCSWFEQFRVAQYSLTHLTSPGQMIPPIAQEYIVFRCVKCHEIFQPNMSVLGGSLLKDYNGFLEELDSPLPEPITPTVAPTKPENETP